MTKQHLHVDMFAGKQQGKLGQTQPLRLVKGTEHLSQEMWPFDISFTVPWLIPFVTKGVEGQYYDQMFAVPGWLK